MKIYNLALALGLAGTGLIGNIKPTIAAPFPPPPVEYQVNNVKFADGATLTGTFDYLPFPVITGGGADYYSNINLSISGGTDDTFPSVIIAGEAYSQYGPSGNPTGVGFYGGGAVNSGGISGFSQVLDLSFNPALTGQPGDISSVTAFQGVGFFDPPLNQFERVTATRNSIVGGFVSAVVPEPSEILGTLAFGTLAAGYLVKRQIKKT